MHEIAGDEEGFATGDEEGHADVDRSMAKGNIRCAYGNHGAEQKGIKDKQVPANMMAEMIGRVLVAHKIQVG